MQITVFNTPILSLILALTARSILKIFGWKKEGHPPRIDKYVLIAAPYTSNWDFVMTMLFAFAFPVKIFWTGKREIFRFPLGIVVRWLGGIPMDRSRSQNAVDQTVKMFNQREKLVMIIPPEGTQDRVNRWRTGFYYIAYGARVPIALGFVDWKRKTGGFGPVVIPTGDIKSDMGTIKDFYSYVTAKYPERTGRIDVSREAHSEGT